MNWDSLEEEEPQGAEGGDGEGGGNDGPGVASYQVAPAVLTNRFDQICSFYLTLIDRGRWSMVVLGYKYNANVHYL